MSVSVQDVLRVDVVLVHARLLGAPDERAQFSANTGAIPDAGGGLILADTAGGKLEQTIRLIVPRDRLAIELNASRIQVATEYPQSIEAVDLLEDLVAAAIEATETPGPPISYGFNIQLTYTPDMPEHTAFAYLGRLFAAGSDLRMGRLIGGSCRMLFDDLDDQDVKWTAALEPRFNREDTGLIYLQLNEHVSNGGEFPGAGDVSSKARLLWQRAGELMDAIDGLEPVR